MAEEEELAGKLEEAAENGLQKTAIEKNKGLSLAIVPLVLGILLIFITIGIKLSGIDPVMGIGNPSGSYGEYFLSGIGVGLIIFGVGAAMATISKKKVKEPKEEESEIVDDEGICPTCGEIIPIDSTECSECGEKLAPSDEYGKFVQVIEKS